MGRNQAKWAGWGLFVAALLVLRHAYDGSDKPWWAGPLLPW